VLDDSPLRRGARDIPAIGYRAVNNWEKWAIGYACQRTGVQHLSLFSIGGNQCRALDGL
jgi:hypothetical protein